MSNAYMLTVIIYVVCIYVVGEILYMRIVGELLVYACIRI